MLGGRLNLVKYPYSFYLVNMIHQTALAPMTTSVLQIYGEYFSYANFSEKKYIHSCFFI